VSEFLKANGYAVTVVGLPKTIDNDVVPIRQSLGAWTAAEQGARFFENVVNEASANPRMLIIHECMGRDCGYLTAATAKAYRDRLGIQWFIDELGFSRAKKEVHAIYIPEIAIDIRREASRLKAVMDELDCVNIFLSEGAGVQEIVAEMEADGQEVPRDAFGHVKLDKINPGHVSVHGLDIAGDRVVLVISKTSRACMQCHDCPAGCCFLTQWFAAAFGPRILAEKVLVQKSGYFARSSAPNLEDRKLIEACADVAIEAALHAKSGCAFFTLQGCS
jgi:pyrophosphate--fructose-6-phosphate 1-phosphotransferase